MNKSGFALLSSMVGLLLAGCSKSESYQKLVEGAPTGGAPYMARANGVDGGIAADTCSSLSNDYEMKTLSSGYLYTITKIGVFLTLAAEPQNMSTSTWVVEPEPYQKFGLNLQYRYVTVSGPHSSRTYYASADLAGYQAQLDAMSKQANGALTAETDPAKRALIETTISLIKCAYR